MATEREWWAQLAWVVAAMVVGVGVAAVFSGALRLPRAWVVLVYLAVGGAFLYGYFHWSGIDLGEEVRRHWVWGLVGAVVAGAFVVKNVWSQDISPQPQGLRLAFDLVWLGLVYGTLDALLLSVMPVLATWHAFSRLGWTEGWPGRVAVGALALVASLAVTAAYHWGYREFRGPTLASPVFGNGVMSLGYLVTANPLAAWVSHVAMHVAAVLHGMQTAMQLPPHY